MRSRASVPLSLVLISLVLPVHGFAQSHGGGGQAVAPSPAQAQEMSRSTEAAQVSAYNVANQILDLAELATSRDGAKPQPGWNDHTSRLSHQICRGAAEARRETFFSSPGANVCTVVSAALTAFTGLVAAAGMQNGNPAVALAFGVTTVPGAWGTAQSIHRAIATALGRDDFRNRLFATLRSEGLPVPRFGRRRWLTGFLSTQAWEYVELATYDDYLAEALRYKERVYEILDFAGFGTPEATALLEFANALPNPDAAGRSLGRVEWQVRQADLIEKLVSAKLKLRELVASLKLDERVIPWRDIVDPPLGHSWRRASRSAELLEDECAKLLAGAGS